MTTTQPQTITDPDTPFRTLLSQYLNLVYSSALRQLRNAHLAEDATQAVFILLHQRLPHIPQNRLSSWLLTATRYTCANIRKTERRRAHREQVAAMNHPLTTSPQNPPDPIDALLPLLDDALATLPSLDREALALHFLQQQPYPQLAATLNISEAAARKRTSRALHKLRSYFTRHGITTSTASLSTFLPTQANAVTAQLHDALTQSILHTCRTGAAAPITALTKGTQTMMTLHSLKPAALITAAILLAATASLTWHFLAAPANAAPQVATAAPTPTPAPIAVDNVPATTAPSVTVDLSTPDNTLASYVKALHAGDRAAVFACTTADPNRTPTAGDAFLALNLAQNRLILAAAKAFTSTGQEARQFMTVDVFLAKLLAFNKTQNQSATITGDSATIPFNLPDRLIANAPEEIQKQVRAFTGRPVHLIKQGNDWKLDGATHVAIQLTTPDGTLVQDPQTQITVILEYAAIYDKLATELNANTYPTWQDATPILKSDIHDLHQKYNITDIHIELAPAPGNP